MATDHHRVVEVSIGANTEEIPVCQWHVGRCTAFRSPRYSHSHLADGRQRLLQPLRHRRTVSKRKCPGVPGHDAVRVPLAVLERSNGRDAFLDRQRTDEVVADMGIVDPCRSDGVVDNGLKDGTMICSAGPIKVWVTPTYVGITGRLRAVAVSVRQRVLLLQPEALNDGDRVVPTRSRSMRQASRRGSSE